jgi:hypothetical protein
MPNVEQNATNFHITVGPIAMSEKNAQKAEVWAEGTDEQVAALGGTHSAKGWAIDNKSYIDGKIDALATVATTGSYNDLSDKPTIPTNVQTTTNLVTSVSSSSTDSQYPSAKLFYDTCGNIEALINAL